MGKRVEALTEGDVGRLAPGPLFDKWVAERVMAWHVSPRGPAERLEWHTQGGGAVGYVAAHAYPVPDVEMFTPTRRLTHAWLALGRYWGRAGWRCHIYDGASTGGTEVAICELARGTHKGGGRCVTWQGAVANEAECGHDGHPVALAISRAVLKAALAEGVP